MPPIAKPFMLALLLTLASSDLRAADPFYLRLLRQGSESLERRDLEEARRLLRLANFGLLDDPELLAEGLVKQALAESGSGQQEAFSATFTRILEIEERFQAYSQAPLPASLRQRFEDVVASQVSAATLAGSEAFRPLAHRKALERVLALPRKDRPRALAELLARDPGEETWSLMLAELQIEDGDEKNALGTLAALLAARPDHPRGLCLRGRALAASGRCTEAIRDLETCAERSREAKTAGALLDCYAAGNRWQAAEVFFATLDPGLKSSREMLRFEKRIARGLRQTGAAGAVGNAVPNPGEPQSDTGTPGSADPGRDPAPEAAPTDGGGSPRGEAIQGGRSAPLPPAAAAQLEEARRMLSRARHASDLAEALDLARRVADAHPGNSGAQHLAAEIAYRASRWTQAAQYFRRGGDPGDERPNLLFFMAVSFYEIGDLAAARAALRRSLPKLQKTEFVEDYSRKILGGTGP